jgi:hypothetical protein
MDRYYRCPTCDKVVQRKSKRSLGFSVHDHYVAEIGRRFADDGCLIIQEGTIPAIPENWDEPWIDGIRVEYRSQGWRDVIRRWRRPDLIVLKDDRLIEVIEVLGTADDYRILAAKVAKINRYISPPQTVVLNAVRYVDRFLKQRRRKKLRGIIGFEPSSYREVDQYYQQKLEREHGLRFTLWSEEDLMQLGVRQEAVR